MSLKSGSDLHHSNTTAEVLGPMFEIFKSLKIFSVDVSQMKIVDFRNLRSYEFGFQTVFR